MVDGVMDLQKEHVFGQLWFAGAKKVGAGN